MKRFVCTIALLIVSVGTVVAQRISAEVVEVIDGKTIVVSSTAGRLTVQLHAIDTPEKEQPLHAATREHLSKMVKGRKVEYQPMQITDGVSIAKVSLDGVDVSLQMIRDGAAWHLPVQLSGQSSLESGDYASNQEMARKESRGVWSQSLKPAWELRAERAENERKLEAIKRIGKPNYVVVSDFKTANSSEPYRGSGKNGNSTRMEMDAWVSVYAERENESYGLKTHMDPAGRYGTVYTSAAYIYLGEGEKKQRLECRALYVTVSLPNGGKEAFYLLGFRAISAAYTFSVKRSTMSAVVDNQAIGLGTPRGLRGESTIGAEEILYYRIGKASLKKIAEGKKVVLKVNGLSGEIDES